MVFSIEASSISAVNATRRNLQDLIIVTDYSLLLWTGGTLLTKLLVPDTYQVNFSAQTAKRRRPSNEDRIEKSPSAKIFRSPTKLKIDSVDDFVYDRVNIFHHDGSIVRVSCRFKPSRLVQSVFDAISWTVESSFYEIFWNRFLALQFSDSAGNIEWDNLVIVFLSFCHLKSDSRLLNIASNDWENLLMSKFHLNHGSDPCFKDFKVDLGFLESFESRCAKSLDLFMQSSNQPNILDFIVPCVFALHLLYQDLKLDITKSQEAIQLGKFVYFLANSLDWKSLVSFYQDQGVEISPFKISCNV